jgi:hypothetical protein
MHRLSSITVPKMPSNSEAPAVSEKINPTEKEDVQKKLDQAISYAIEGGRIQERADQTRQRAKSSTNAKEKKALEKEAKELDAQAKQQLKTTQRLQSGVWQGFGAGAGIGASSGLAVGSGVGLLTGGILAVPMTGLGGLIGAGTGALHGPWIKLTRGDDGPRIEEAKENEPGAIQLVRGWGKREAEEVLMWSSCRMISSLLLRI